MSHHEGVSCDTCLKTNFRGKRYKCLVCFDYDLCAACHDSNAMSGRHHSDHAMQCILTRNDIKLFYAGEASNNGQPHAFTCPFCGGLGYNEVNLYEHVCQAHSDATSEVLCPVCVTLPHGEPNQLTRDFITHMRLDHRTTQDSISFSSNIVRLRSRRVNNGSSGSNGASSGGGGAFSSRYAGRRQNFSSSGASSTNGSTTGGGSGRDIDPIAQLLNQLSDVRRYTASISSNSGGGGGGGSGNSNRITLGQILSGRRPQNQPQSTLSSSASAMASHGGSSNHSTISNASTSNRLFAEPPNASSHHGGQHKSAPSSSSSFFTSHAHAVQSREFILKGLTLPSLSSAEQEALETIKADQSLFLQELLFATLSDSLDIEQLTCDDYENKERDNDANWNESKREARSNDEDKQNTQTMVKKDCSDELTKTDSGKGPDELETSKIAKVNNDDDNDKSRIEQPQQPSRAQNILTSLERVAIPNDKHQQQQQQEACSTIVVSEQPIRAQRADSSNLHSVHKANPFASTTTSKYNHLGAAPPASFLPVTPGRAMQSTSTTQRKPRPPPGVVVHHHAAWATAPTPQSSAGVVVGGARRKSCKQTTEPPPN